LAPVVILVQDSGCRSGGDPDDAVCGEGVAVVLARCDVVVRTGRDEERHAVKATPITHKTANLLGFRRTFSR
jgi:hypothetical protein